MPALVLIIDDEESVAWGLRKICEREGLRVSVAASAEDGLKQAEAQLPDVIFLDVRLPGMDGLTALGKLQKLVPDSAVIVITAHGNLSTAVKAVAGGAFDYLSKPFDMEQARDALHRAIERTSSADVLPTFPVSDEEIVGRSAAIQTLFKRIALVAPTEACVMITGESGTGKELVARAIHANSPRRAKPFLPIHIAALNPNLVESELFGHVRGAFTGADRAHPGLIALAHGGTIFLDELGDIPLGVQAKLLRVLERQEVLPVGGATPQPVDVRIVSATNANLEDAVRSGQFRHDLFFRLNVYPIHLPALRDRIEDIPVLAEHLLRQFSKSAPVPSLSADALAELQLRAWPGNVRELKNALEHAAILSRGAAIHKEHLPEASQVTGVQNTQERIASLVREWVRTQARAAAGSEPAELHQTLMAIVEPALLAEVLQQLDGNRLVAGRWLGLARATVRKLIRKYQLDGDSGSDDPDEE